MSNFEDLPNEIILKILLYLKKLELFQIARVSKRFYEICQNELLWQNMNLSDQTITTKSLEYFLSKGCKYLSLQGAYLDGNSNIQTSKLKYLNLSYCDANAGIFEDLVNSSVSIEKLSNQIFCVTTRFVQGIVQNGQCLKILDLS